MDPVLRTRHLLVAVSAEDHSDLFGPTLRSSRRSTLWIEVHIFDVLLQSVCPDQTRTMRTPAHRPTPMRTVPLAEISSVARPPGRRSEERRVGKEWGAG